MAAFALSPPLIHAGGPFSDRAGAHRDDFADFVPLDRQAELGWRIRLEGSRGIPEREFAGPVTGLQEIYRTGTAYLDHLSQRAHGVGFVQASTAARDALLDEAGTDLSGPSTTAHIIGTARMGADPGTSVVDPHGRLHELENVYAGDGSVFVSSGGFNPTLTIMALSLRMARHLSGASTTARRARPQPLARSPRSVE